MMTTPQPSPATVFVVDDDEAVRDSLALLLRSVELAVATFSSAHEFLDSYDPAAPGCLILDVRLPGMSGLELQQRLADDGADLPIVFITGHGDVPMAVRAMRRGAVDFLQKPFSDQELLDRVQQALAEQSQRRQQSESKAEIAQRIRSLTPREHEVMELIVEGLANKVIANRLGTSQRTVEVHRASVMRKMQADSVARLVHLVFAADSQGS
ncbi:MAG: response regulator transcription factor [Thermoanaerobaculia bacterium]